jgi:hypothetical protein
VRAWQQPGGVREAQRLASVQTQQFTPFDYKLSSSFAAVFAAKNLLQNLDVRESRCSRGFDQALFVGEAHSDGGRRLSQEKLSCQLKNRIAAPNTVLNPKGLG